MADRVLLAVGWWFRELSRGDLSSCLFLGFFQAAQASLQRGGWISRAGIPRNRKWKPQISYSLGAGYKTMASLLTCSIGKTVTGNRFKERGHRSLSLDR
jgi:hypothetical protein